MTVPSTVPEPPGRSVRSARDVRRIVLSVAVVVLIAVVLMAACGNRDDDPPADATPAGATSTTADTPAAQPATQVEPATAGATTEPAAPTDETTGATTTTLPIVAAGEVTGAQSATDAVSTASSDAGSGPACAVETSAELAGYDALVDRMGCPTGEASIEPVAISEFGEGPEYNRFMLWFGNEQQIFVLQPDGAWLAYTDTWSENEPEIVCNPDRVEPATSPPLPRRGFGKLWCTVESVRLSMGLIDREERLCQHAVVQHFDQGRLVACFEDATIRYFRILEDGAWDMEMVQ